MPVDNRTVHVLSEFAMPTTLLRQHTQCNEFVCAEPATPPSNRAPGPAGRRKPRRRPSERPVAYPVYAVSGLNKMIEFIAGWCKRRQPSIGRAKVQFLFTVNIEANNGSRPRIKTPAIKPELTDQKPHTPLAEAVKHWRQGSCKQNQHRLTTPERESTRNLRRGGEEHAIDSDLFTREHPC